MKLAELKPNTQVKDMTVLCDEVIVGMAKNDSPYLSLHLKDASGVVVARLWSATPDDITAWQTGKVYTVCGSVSTYRDSNQLKITSYQKTNSEHLNWNELIPTAPIDSEIAYANIQHVVTNFENHHYQKILLAMLEEYGDQLKVWPAAVRIHHAVRSGLLWHTVTMLKIAQQLLKIYADREIDGDLLLAGVILHDLGKVIEINSAVDNTFSEEGKLIGHISIMQAEINRIASTLDVDQKYSVLLQHMVIASHGKLEFGSPVAPRIIEAEILSLIDTLDAKVFIVNSALQKIALGKETPKLFAMDHRSFIRHFQK